MSSLAFNYGSYCWVPDEENMFLPGKVLEPFSAGEKGKVSMGGENADEQTIELSEKDTKLVQRMDEQSLSPIDNMVELKELNEASILHNLRLQFQIDKIYTNVGTILVSVNPFKSLNIYTVEVLEQYRTKGYRNMPPHVYGVADEAYRHMTADNTNQSCIVSGESGAGKTEATKIFLQYITEVSGKDDVESKDGKATLHEQILKSNPLMEAFGNAKTVRNDNSSRFGKWIEINFNKNKGTIVGASIIQYLLEKSRLVSQAQDERNYHIFYNLCAGAQMDSTIRDKFRIGDVEDYHYLNQSGVTEVETINDEADWENVMDSMEVTGISIDEQDDIIRTLAGILHLGNILFEDGGGDHADGSKVTNSDMLELAANQLGTESEKLEKALCYRSMRTNKDTTYKINNKDQAVDARDALAKGIYALMFEWLINRINQSLAEQQNLDGKKMKKDSINYIGILDIFGFESFEWNSFEQLCINYCNEKLQFHFNDHIFKLEQNEYKAEGIDVSQIQFADNQPTLDMFEKKGTGIYATLDEEMTVPKGSDNGFLVKLTKKLDGHSNFRKPGVKTNYERNSFTVIHYAGEVMYNVQGFLEKNRDSLNPDLSEVLAASKHTFIAGLFKNVESDSGKGKGGGKKKLKSLGSKFKNQLQDLMKTLQKTAPHFIRCVKPNEERRGDIFTAHMVLAQLRYAGLLEVCRIRQIGYPVRKNFLEFYRRYRVLTPGAKDAKHVCKELEENGSLPSGEYQIGKNKVFLRNGPYNELEAQRDVAVKDQVILLQRYIRGFIAKRQLKKFKAITKQLEQAIKTRTMEALTEAIGEAGDLPYSGKHLPVVKKAHQTIERLKEEQRVTNLIKAAIEKRELNALNAAVGAADELIFSSPVVDEAKKLIALIKEENEAIGKLKDAINSRDLATISMALATATKLGLGDRKESQQAEILRVRLEEEERIVRDVETATTAGVLEKLKDALNSALEAGLGENPVVKKGNEKMEELMTQIEAQEAEKIREEEEKKKAEHAAKMKELKSNLAAAVKSGDLEQINEAKQAALKDGLDKADLDKLIESANQVEANQESASAIEAAMSAMQTAAESKSGISEKQVQTLSNTIEQAKKDGMSEEHPLMMDAMDLEDKMKSQLDVQKRLEEAIKDGSFDVLREALQQADDLNMDTDLVAEVRIQIREKDSERPVSFRKPQVEEGEELGEDEIERQRKQNMNMAKHERYAFHKFYKIRDPADYVKGVYFQKRKLLETQKKYQKTIIPKSILQLESKELNKMAIGINKSLLGYCGEQLMSFPATLAQDILIKGLEQPELVDEIYIQLCKHLTENNRPESVGRAWQLMCMAVGTFPPSSDFEYYLLNFLIEHISAPSLVGQYARYSLRRLEGMLIRGASGFVPNIDEILAYKERPPVLSTIELVDGTPLTEDLPVPPDLNVEKVLEICTHFLSLEDPRSKHFGIFVQDSEDDDEYEEAGPQSGYSARRQESKTGGQAPPIPLDELPPLPPSGNVTELPRTPRPLRSKDYMGDVVIQMTRLKRKITFVFKRKIFLPNDDDKSDDPVYSRLMYLQAADEVIKSFIPVEKEADVLLLTAIALAADLEEFPNKEKDLIDADLMEYIPSSWRSQKTEANWARAVLAQRGKVIRKDNDVLENLYIDKVSKFPLWGQSFFFCRKDMSGGDMVVGISYAGINFYDLKRKPTGEYKFNVLQRWGGSSTQFWVLVLDAKKKQKKKVKLFTSQARDMSNLILDYAVLASENKQGEQAT